MDAGIWVRAVAIGVAIAAPVGPIGLLCMQRTLIGGFGGGFVSGLGAASADAVYGAVGTLGLTVLAESFTRAQLGLQLLGGIYLCYLGATTYRQAPATGVTSREGGLGTPTLNRSRAGSSPVGPSGLVSNYITTFLLTLSNPATILSFAALYAGLGFSAARASYPAAVLFIVGVFCGSAFWWLGLSSGVNMVRHTLRPIHLRWLNRLSGLAIAGFGLLAIATVPLVHRVP